jgi:hypothetical protein
MHVLKGASPAFRVPGSPAVDPEGSRLAGYLAEHLGPDLTAYVSGVDNEDLVARWIAKEAAPEPLLLGRLRAVEAATRCLVSRYGDDTARTWFAGMNPWLDDEAPGYVLRHSSDQETWDSVVAASKDFAELIR